MILSFGKNMPSFTNSQTFAKCKLLLSPNRDLLDLLVPLDPLDLPVAAWTSSASLFRRKPQIPTVAMDTGAAMTPT